MWTKVTRFASARLDVTSQAQAMSVSLPGSVIGNTAAFGAVFPGSSPGRAANPHLTPSFSHGMLSASMVPELGVLVKHGQYFRRRNPAVAPNRGDVRSDYGIPTRGLSILGDSEGGLRQTGPPRREPGGLQEAGKSPHLSRSNFSSHPRVRGHPSRVSRTTPRCSRPSRKSRRKPPNLPPIDNPLGRRHCVRTPSRHHLPRRWPPGQRRPPLLPPPINARRRQQGTDRRVDRGETAHAASRRAAGQTPRVRPRQLRRRARNACSCSPSCWSKNNS